MFDGVLILRGRTVSFGILRYSSQKCSDLDTSIVLLPFESVFWYTGANINKVSNVLLNFFSISMLYILQFFLVCTICRKDINVFNIFQVGY